MHLLVRFAVIAVIALQIGACDILRGDPPADQGVAATATPAPTPRSGGSAGSTPAAPLVTPTVTPTPAPSVPPERASATLPASSPGSIWFRVSNTDGVGVAVRDMCAQDARVSAAGDGMPEGADVELLRDGAAACPGWLLVRDDRGRESWVREQYLASVPAAGAGAAPTPAAGAGAAPTPAAGAEPERAGGFYERTAAGRAAVDAARARAARGWGADRVVPVADVPEGLGAEVLEVMGRCSWRYAGISIPRVCGEW